MLVCIAFDFFVGSCCATVGGGFCCLCIVFVLFVGFVVLLLLPLGCEVIC